MAPNETKWCSIKDKRSVESNYKMLLKFLVDQQDGVIIDRHQPSNQMTTDACLWGETYGRIRKAVTAMTHPWTPSPACSLVCARGFVDSCWSWLDAADAKDPVMCTINTISGWPRVWALMNILLKLNPRWPVIVSSFISLVTTWPSICTNKQSLLWFYWTLSWFQQTRVTNNSNYSYCICHSITATLM